MYLRGRGAVFPAFRISAAVCSAVASCPAGEDVERVPCGRAGFGAVGDDGLPGIGWDLQGVVVQVEVAG